MKKSFFLITFLFLCNILFAQRIDSVRTGIKSVKYKVCGYQDADSTGLLLYSEKRYDKRGRKIVEIQWENKVDEVHERAGNEEEAFSYFYDAQTNQKGNLEFDTTYLKYDSKGCLVEKITYYRYGDTIKHVYGYDAKGRNTTFEFYRNGKLEMSANNVYDSDGKFLSRSSTVHNKTELEYRTTYGVDGKALFTELFPEGSNEIDSSVISHSANGKTVMRLYLNMKLIYDKKDSIIGFVYYAIDRTSEKQTLVSIDSTSITRDSDGYIISQVKFRSGVKAESYYLKYDGKHRIVEKKTMMGEKTVKTETWEYNDEQHFANYKRYGAKDLKELQLYIYNAKGDLVEIRLMDVKGKLLLREVYEYEYY